MIISRKRFEQELEKARAAAIEDHYEEERKARTLRDIYKMFECLEKRIAALENPVPTCGCSCGEAKEE